MSSKKQQTEENIMAELNYFPFQLQDSRLYEIMVERFVVEEEEEKETHLSLLLKVGDEPLDAEEFSLLLTFETNLFSEDSNSGCNLQLSIEGHFASIVDVSTIKPEVIKKFKEVDSLVLLWPYLRQMFSDITDRLRLSVAPLPIIDPRALLSTEEGSTSEG